jgi:hypothetical protein
MSPVCMKAEKLSYTDAEIEMGIKTQAAVTLSLDLTPYSLAYFTHPCFKAMLIVYQTTRCHRRAA